jgi:outer membrane receptor protein involved in Fe transport
MQLNYQPWTWFTHRLSLGVDETNEEAESLIPRLPTEYVRFFGATAALGSKALGKRELTTTTLDYSASATYDLASRIGTKTSVGAQYYRKFTKNATLSGTVFPAPGVTSLSSAATRSVSESFVENVTLGAYVQEQVSFSDRLFLTAAIRADDNSAFGEDFDLVTYPKVSGSWVMSEEPFWPFSFLSTFRLRAAWGKTGTQPDQFAAVRTYSALPGPGGVAAVRPLLAGNANLGPEKGEEIELGFEAGFFDDRVGVDFTVYDKRTRDAILARQVSPSLGFPGTALTNIGEVMNRGFELQVQAAPIASRNTRLDLVFGLAHNKNKILDMAGVPDINPGAINQYHREGFPAFGFFERVVVSADVVNNAPANAMCDSGRDGGFQGGPPVPCATAPRVYFGQPWPKFEGSFNATLQLGTRLTIAGLLDFKTGYRVFSADLGIQCQILRLCLPNVDPSTDPKAAAEMALFVFGPYQTPEVSFAKIRNLSVSYRIPERWARIAGATGALLTVSARNVATFTDFKLGVDPEIVVNGAGANYFVAFNQVPTPFEFVSALRLTF